MTVEIDSTVFSAIVGGVGAVVATLAGVIAHLYLGRERDRAAYMAHVLAIANTLREEDAREKDELRAQVALALAAPSSPPSQRSPHTRTRKR